MEVASLVSLRSLSAAVTLVCAFCASSQRPASAQAYPDKPVRIVVAFGPGGIADTIGRLIGQKLNDRFGQPIVVDNRPGAGGALAARLVAGATPDGYTLLVTTTAIAVNVSAVKDAVDPRTQLVAVAIAASAPTIFAVHRSVGAKTLMEYLRVTKQGRFNYATAGVGTTEHLTSEYIFRAVPSLEATHVPYQGGTAPVAATAGQQVDMVTTTIPTASIFIKQGTLRVLAVASRKRIPALPDVPTLAESGFPAFENASWIAFFAPAKAPAAVVRTLNAEVNNALRQADVRERLTALGFDIQTRSQPELAEYVKSEVAKWVQVIKVTGITPN
jgi:tripartite-type tricarboxylate transporter receptor subunit TctC